MKTLKIVLLAVLVIVTLSACDTPYQLKISNDAKYTTVNSNVVRFVDEQAGVVCWVYSHQKYREGGISCLPLAETTLGE